MMSLVSFFTRSTIIPINAWKSKQCETVLNYHFYHIKVKMSCRHGHWHFRGDLFINSNKFMQTVYYNFIFKILDLFGVFMQIGGDSAHKQKKLHLAQSVHLRPATHIQFYPWKMHRCCNAIITEYSVRCAFILPMENSSRCCWCCVFFVLAKWYSINDGRS